MKKTWYAVMNPGRRAADPTAERLKRLRLALGFPQAAAFARFLGLSKARWNNYERGYPLPREIIFLLCEKVHGLTSDWLYFGYHTHLPLDLAKKLGELDGPTPNGPASKAVKRRKRRL
jgi:transcriptional regulator with XRE-family HTH domain